MKKKFFVFVSALVALSPGVAFAAGQNISQNLSDLLSTWGPLILLIVLWPFFMKKYRAGTVANMKGQEEQLKRIADSVERIEKILEKQGTR